ncbi:MAG TPA: hypothetical protein VJN68_14080 [Burkholderiaceae bacterium]|nr:hypothetical protein [Burkholderiaceae bacterium]
MATELTWSCDVNRAVASAADAATQSKWELWYLLASLVGNTGLGFASNAGNWSIVRTCGSTDGTAGNLTADTTDRLHLGGSGAFTANDWVFGANTTSGTGRSWALLQSPSTLGSMYLIVDFGNATNGKCDLVIGKTLSTNGTTTARPTLTDEWSYSGAQFNNNSIAATHRVNLHLSTRGDFWWHEIFDTNGLPYAAFAVTKLQSTHAADNYPTISMFVGGNTVGSAGAGFSGAVNAGGFGTVTSAITKGRNYSGSSLPTWVAILPSFGNAGAYANLLTATNAINANASDTTYNGLPIWIIDVSGPELKGRIADLMWASGTPAQGSTIPNTTPFNYVKFGNVWMPWVSTSAPLI